MTKKGLAATVLVMALLSAASPAGALVSETSGLACQSHARRTLRSQNLETVDARTFHIEAKAAGKRFKVGAVVPMTVTVTRPAEQDPFNLGIPLDSPVSQAAPDVMVGVGLSLGDIFLTGFGITDENGRAKVRMKIAKYAPAGSGIISIYAYKVDADTPCLRINENGFRQYPGMFKVKK